MNRKLAVSAVVALFGFAAFGVVGARVDLLQLFKGGFRVTSNATALSASANTVTGMYGLSDQLIQPIIVDGGTCLDNAAITLTGVQPKDPCSVGVPDTAADGGSLIDVAANCALFKCRVSAANAVKLTRCACGANNVSFEQGKFDIRVTSNR